MGIRFRRRPVTRNEVIGTYGFSQPQRWQVLKTQDDRILWTCDCDKFRRQSGPARTLVVQAHRPRPAARRSLERLNAPRCRWPAGLER